jgi:hypothetical protein
VVVADLVPGKDAKMKIIEKRVPRLNKWDESIPAVGECVCGERICLSSSDNECTCGRRYNLVGNELRRLTCHCSRCVNGLEGCPYEE